MLRTGMATAMVIIREITMVPKTTAHITMVRDIIRAALTIREIMMTTAMIPMDTAMVANAIRFLKSKLLQLLNHRCLVLQKSRIGQ